MEKQQLKCFIRWLNGIGCMHVCISTMSVSYMYIRTIMYIIFPAMIANFIACIQYAKENNLLSL